MALVTGKLPTLKARCLEARAAAVRASMRRQQIELLIAYGSGDHNFTAMNPAWYVSGFKQMGPHLAVLLPLEGELTMIVTPPWDARRARERSEIDDVRAVEPAEFLSTLEQCLQRRGLAGKRTAVAGGDMQPRRIREAWTTLLGDAPLDAEKLVSDVAKIRDAWSLECVRRAAEIAVRGYDSVLEVARPGVAEHVVQAHLERRMRELGSEDNFFLCSSSQHNPNGHQPTDRVLERGDILLGEITPSVDGEFVQICRTTVIGPPSATLREKFDLLVAGFQAGLKAARPGATVGSVVDAINKPLIDAGYEEYARPPWMRTRGHCMGMGSQEPELMFEGALPLEQGEVFVMHPNQYLPETGYLMCGDPVIIEEDGARPLTSSQARLVSV